MKRVTYKDVAEYRNCRFVAEASTLGFPPGRWPRTLYTDIGNRQPFTIGAARVSADGEIRGVTYRQALGCVSLYVIND